MRMFSHDNINNKTDKHLPRVCIPYIQIQPKINQGKIQKPITKHTPGSIINNVLEEFLDILCDDLAKEPMQGPPTKIDLLPNAVPKCIVYTKSVPLPKEKYAFTC